MPKVDRETAVTVDGHPGSLENAREGGNSSDGHTKGVELRFN
jgi:hypothetical protein